MHMALCAFAALLLHAHCQATGGPAVQPVLNGAGSTLRRNLRHEDPF
eukprot:SAG22_NODE_13696_length_397_cov_1.382550_1_plen_46_part_01